MKARIKRILSGGLGLLAVMTPYVHASGYKLEFQSPAVLADAGDAAVIDDASTNWYNSAGLVYLPQQLVGSVIDVYQHTTFYGTSTAPSLFGSSFSGTGKATSHPNAILPAIHYSLPFENRFAFGLSIVPAWGLLEDYGETSVLRYNLTRIYTRTLDVEPSVAMKLNAQWSVGVGPDFHYMAVQSKNHVRTELLTPDDSISRFSVDHWNYGGHAGLLYRLNDATRFGLNYRSKIVMNLDGFSDFAGEGVGSLESRAFKLRIPLPPTTTLSVYHDMTPTWAMMGSLAYDQWNVLNNYSAQNYIILTGATIPVVVPQELHNTIDVGIGTHYQLTDQWMLRGSVKYEPTPTNDRYRDVNFPDGPKLGLNIGAHYQMSKKLAFDLIYAHVFTRSVPINVTAPVTNVSTSGSTSTSIDLVGAQLVWDI